ncbi:guanitoxin biosynthesis heme-dependent pre-guanitoxin N-hydroxylase GntA [Parvibaculum lavamentivorans]|nr:guanitoxin biosynthesis heme-dependent pre-guanitoxin N-hydroxylase GntA [Parvibaculum lavamentivorans]
MYGHETILDLTIFGDAMTQGKHSLCEEFRAFVRQTEFPCVGAKSALSRDQLVLMTAADIRCPADDRKIVDGIYAFLREHEARPRLFTSFAVVFQGPQDLGEMQFEQHLWERLSALHKLDAEDFAWSDEVSADPNSPDFGFSLGGHAFFIVGLHPGSSRTARRLPHPAIVFNLHEQFQNLRQNGQYNRIKETIIHRDAKLDGAPNPMIAEHGTVSEARQYSGRPVSGRWRCPFAR